MGKVDRSWFYFERNEIEDCDGGPTKLPPPRLGEYRTDCEVSSHSFQEDPKILENFWDLFSLKA